MAANSVANSVVSEIQTGRHSPRGANRKRKLMQSQLYKRGRGGRGSSGTANITQLSRGDKEHRAKIKASATSRKNITKHLQIWKDYFEEA